MIDALCACPIVHVPCFRTPTERYRGTARIGLTPLSAIAESIAL
jgi:hypothetical protein